MINTYINEGKIVPAEVTVRLLHNAMEQALKESNKNKFLVDGFPRDLGNLQCWTEKLSDLAETKFLLFLDCPTEIMVDRLVENFAGHWSFSFLPFALHRLLERGKTSGRSDDNIDSIRKRLVTYEESTRPIIEHFREQGKVRQVDSNRDIEVVYSEVAQHFSEA